MDKSLLALALALSACAAQPKPASQTAAEVAPAGATSPPQSGGASIAEAQPISGGSTVEGWVAANKPRYYRIDLAEGAELKLTWYAAIIRDTPGSGVTNVDLAVLDENGGALGNSSRISTSKFTDGGSFERGEFKYVAKKAGPGFLHVSCDWCPNIRVQYKIVIP